jgi:hypothetical protein
LPRFSSRLIAAGALLAAGSLASGAARAQDAGFALQPYDPSAASDRFFAVSDATAPGDKQISARADALYAYKRLLSGVDPATGDSGDVVSSHMYVYAGATIALDDRFLFGISLPIVPVQSGDLDPTPGAGIGDLKLKARFAVFDFGPVARVAPEIDLSVPTGSQEDLTGDGSFGAHARAHFSGEYDLFVYAANVGYLIRDPKDMPGITIGPAGSFGLAFGCQLLDKKLQLAGELQGQTQLTEGVFDGPTTPVYALAGAKFRVSDFVVGAAGGPSLSEGIGSSPRAVLSVGYVPLP